MYPTYFHHAVFYFMMQTKTTHLPYFVVPYSTSSLAKSAMTSNKKAISTPNTAPAPAPVPDPDPTTGGEDPTKFPPC